MAQSQQPHVRTFIAVDFRGIQQASRERTSLGVVGQASLAAVATLAAPLPEPAERDPEGQPRPQTVGLASATLDLGGEAARAAYAYAALGGMVRLGTTAGSDPAGDLLVRWLEERGVDVAGVRRAGVTAPTLHLESPGYQPLALAPDAAPEPQEELDGALAVLGERGSTLLLAGYPFVGGLRGTRAATLFRAARERGVRTVLSLSPVVLGGSGPPLAPADLEAVLPTADLVCGGAAELRRATRRTAPQEAAATLIGAGAGAVLAKRGAGGAALFRPGPAALEREESSTSAAAAGLERVVRDSLREAVAFGAVYDAAYLLGVAQNDGSPARFAAAAASRVALSPGGVLGI